MATTGTTITADVWTKVLDSQTAKTITLKPRNRLRYKLHEALSEPSLTETAVFDCVPRSDYQYTLSSATPVNLYVMAVGEDGLCII